MALTELFLSVILYYGERKIKIFHVLLYPESIPEDWEMKLELLSVPMAISPLHDKDKAKTGGYKNRIIT